MRGEKGFETSAQGVVIATLAVQPPRALGGWFREGKGEQGFFVRGRHGFGWAGTSKIK